MKQASQNCLSHFDTEIRKQCVGSGNHNEFEYELKMTDTQHNTKNMSSMSRSGQ